MFFVSSPFFLFLVGVSRCLSSMGPVVDNYATRRENLDGETTMDRTKVG